MCITSYRTRYYSTSDIRIKVSIFIDDMTKSYTQ